MQFDCLSRRSKSAFGPKRTSLAAPHMSAFGGKADMALCEFRFRGRYWGKSGHGLVHCICPLLTQSGHHGPMQGAPLAKIETESRINVPRTWCYLVAEDRVDHRLAAIWAIMACAPTQP